MAHVPITDEEIAIKQPAKHSLWEKVQHNFQELFGVISSLGSLNIQNGSFEIDSEGSGIPDGWDFTANPGGTGVQVQSESSHGASSFKMTHPGGAGNGGGELKSDYFECGPEMTYILHSTLRSTLAAVHILVKVEYYDKDKISISTETLYDDSATNPTASTCYMRPMTLPATARFMKIILIGGDTDVDPGASTDIYFDNEFLFIKSSYRAGLVDALNTASVSGSWGTTTPTSVIGPWTMKRQGTVRVYWMLARGGPIAQLAYSQVYVNGSPVGAVHSTTSTTPIQQSEDVPVNPFDLVEIYAWVQSSSDTSDITIANAWIDFFLEW